MSNKAASRGWPSLTSAEATEIITGKPVGREPMISVKHMRNHGAIRRQRRRASRRQEVEAPCKGWPYEPAGIMLPGHTLPDGNPSAVGHSIKVSGMPIGVVVPEGGYAVVGEIETSDCNTGVENHGRLDYRKGKFD